MNYTNNKFMVRKLKNLYFQATPIYFEETSSYKNSQQIPQIKKIQINRCLGLLAQNTKLFKKSIEEFSLITGQYPKITKSKKSIAGFKLRENIDLGITITLRGKRMFSFMDKLINLVLPQIREFKGLDSRKFDKFGNYNFGITDQLIFPEIDYENVEQTLGMNISIVTSAKNYQQGLILIKKVGFPFYI